MGRLEFDCRHRFAGGFELSAAFASEQPVTALFGPSGSGKTTVLSIIAGFLHPQAGCVTLDGRTLFRRRPEKPRYASAWDRKRNESHDCMPLHRWHENRRVSLPPEKRRVGMVFQDHLLFPHLSVLENLRYPRRRLPRRGRPIEWAAVAEALEIQHLLKRYPAQLSGGQQQRVALGRALLSQPDLLLMDEPLASLDAELKSRILAYLQQVVGRWSIPVLLVSHSQTEVRRVADWVVMIEQGRVVAAGKPDDALGTAEALRLKDATGPINLLKIEQVEPHVDHFHGVVGGQQVYVPGSGPVAGATALVKFTPRDVVLSRHDVAGLSARNRLRGKVRQIVRLENAVFAAIDLGQILWAEVTAEAVSEMGLEPGTEVVCLLKARSLEVLG